MVLALAFAGEAPAADLAECAAIGDDAVRLFCYDRAVGRPVAPAQGAPAAPASAAPAAAAAPPVPAAGESRESRPAKATGRIQARMVGTFTGWSPGTRFTLDNGETWEAVGAGTHYSKSEAPAVTIERDFLGQNLMSVEGVKSRALVRRVDP